MDPLSIAAGVAGLCTLAESIVHRTRTFVRCVRGSEKEIAKLIRATVQLYGILEQIRLLEDGFDGDGTREMGIGVGAVMGVHLVKGEEVYECEKTLRKLDVVLRESDPGSVSGFVHVARKKLEWPFSAKEVAELLQDIENHKSVLNLALNANEMAAILARLETSTNVSQIVSQEQLANEEIRASHRKSVFSRRRQKVLDFMTLHDPRIDQTMYIQMKQEMTGLWFTEGDQFKSWMSTKNATLWLSGIPGAGKTILFSSIVDKLEKSSNKTSVLSFFYCDYRNPVKQDATNIIRSLIRQFAERDDSCFDKLEEFYEVHSSNDKTSLPTQSDLAALLIDMSEDVEDALILIDALDECLTERVNVVKLLRDLNLRSKKIKILFSSRDEVDISAQLRGYTIISMAENTSDIARFVESELKVKDWAKDLSHAEKEVIKESLIEPAGGMFRLVACQLDALAKCRTAASRRKVLKTLPRDLSETYYRILKQIDSTEIEDNRLIVQRVLRWVTWGNSGLSLRELQEAVAISPGDKELDPDVITAKNDILDLCSSLVRCNTRGIIELAHATVKDFLTAIPSTSEYYFYRVDKTSDISDLAITCLTYLCLDNFAEAKDWDISSISSEIVSLSSNSSVVDSLAPGGSNCALQYHFLDHAAQNWDCYAEKVTEQRFCILALEKKLFAPHKTPQFLNWARQRLKPTSSNMDQIILAESTPLQWAALLGLSETCQWLIDQGSDINRSTEVLGSSLTCAVLGESILYEQNRNGGSSGSDDGNSDYNDEYDVKESGAWHVETRQHTIVALLECGATMDGIPPEQPRSLMELALIIGEPGHVKLLLSHGGMLDSDCLAYLEKYCGDGPGQGEMQEILTAVSKANCASTDVPRATKLLLQFEKSSNQAAELLANMLDSSIAGEETEVQDKNAILRKASEYGQYELVAQLLGHPDIVIDHKGENGCTALHEAAQCGHLRVIQLLVEKNFSVSARDNDGDTPAIYAAICNHLEVLQFLELHGAVLADQVNNEGETIAAVAAYRDSHRIIRYIAEREPQLVSCATTFPDGMTAFMIATSMGSVKSAQYMLDNLPAEEVTAKAKDGRSLIHFAAGSGDKKILDMLLKKNTDVNTKSKDGSTALHYAVEVAANPMVVGALIRAGANWAIKNDEGDLPLHYAVVQGDWDHFSMLKKLVEAAGEDCQWINEQGGDRLSLLQTVTSHSSFTDYSLKMLELLCERPNLALECLNEDSIGGIPLLNLAHELSQSEEDNNSEPSSPQQQTDAWALSEAIQILVRRGASVNCTDSEGNSALHILCLGYLNHAVYNTIKFLLQNGASTKLVNKDNDTAMDALFSDLFSDIKQELTLSYMDVYVERTLSILIEHSSDDQLKNYTFYGTQLLTICIQIGNPAIVRKMLERGAEVDKPDKETSDKPGWSPARAMCLCKTVDEITDEVLNKCSDLNHVDADGVTLFVLACKHDKIDIVQSLVAKGADLPTTDQGVCALAFAAHRGHTEIVQLLIELGVDVNSPYGNRRKTPLMRAVERGRLATIRLLLDHGADVSIKDNRQWTLAHYLAMREDLNLLQVMLPQNLVWNELATFLASDDDLVTNVTPLHLAARNGFADMIAFLLKNNLIQDVDTRNSSLLTPLHCATISGDLDALKMLLEAGADINAQDKRGNTPVHVAICHSRPSRSRYTILEHLLATGTYDHFTTTEEGQTALHLAARFGTKHMVALLLRTPENVNAKDVNWLTPLYYATVRGDKEIVETLVAAGAKHVAPSSRSSSVDGETSVKNQTLEPPPIFGANSLFLAAIRQQDLSLCKKAVEEGADLSFKFSECKSGKCTPLLFAIDGHQTNHGFISPVPEIAEFLLDQIVDVNVKSCLADILPVHLAAARGQDSVIKKLLARGARTKDRTLEALHFAVLAGNTSTVEMLLEHEKSVDESSKQELLDSQVSSGDSIALLKPLRFSNWRPGQNSYSGSAMHIAASMGHEDILELLIKEGAQLDLLNDFRQSPLMYAIWGDQDEAMQVLLDAGANVHHRDEFGRTPAYYALEHKTSVALTTLQERGADFSEGEYPNSWMADSFLGQALFEEAWENVNFLLKLGHDPNRRYGIDLETPLQAGLRNRDMAKMEAFIVEHAPEYDGNTERYGTLLSSACAESNVALVRKLIEKAKGNGRDIKEYVNTGCYYYSTPLYSAAYRGNMEMLMLLIEEGADVRSEEEGFLGTPLDAACAMERIDVVKVLWEKGACLKKSKMEGPWMAEGCNQSDKADFIRGILTGRDPFVPGPGVDRADEREKSVGEEMVIRQTILET